MKYNLKYEAQVALARERLEFLIDKKVRIDLTEKRDRRSIPQNNYLHLIIGAYAMHIGLTKSEAKQDYKRINELTYVYEKNGTKYLRSSTDLDTKEMHTTIERFRNYCANEVIPSLYIPAPHEQ